MKQSLQIGITGGIGSGKSLVCRIFERLGTPVYDADSKAKTLMATDAILRAQIGAEFGKDSYDGNGNINRTHIAKQVFNNPAKLEKLNRLVHPRVFTDYEQWRERHRTQPYVIKEAALLFEAGSWIDLDKIIVVTAPEDLRLKRVLSRDAHRNADDVRAIIKNQMPEEEKRSRADFVIDNDESDLIIPKILALHREFGGKNPNI